MILFFILFIIVAVIVERWSIVHALDGVNYDMRVSRELLEPEESFDLITTVRNTSWRFIPFIRLAEDVPGTLGAEASLISTGYDDTRAKLFSTIYMNFL